MEGKKIYKYLPANTKRWHLFTFSAFVISLIIFIISFATFIFLQTMIEFNIRQTSNLDTGTILLDKWSNPQYFIRSNMFTFSVKNPDEVTKGAIPSVTKIGPYVFDQTQKRRIHSRGNGSVIYETFQYYHFNEEASCKACSLYNRIWIPNLVYQKFVDAASKPAMRPAIAALLVQTPFLEVEVGELIFDGYADPFIDQVCSLPFVNFVCEQILELPDRIGLFYKKNGSSTGVFEVEDGHKDNGESLGKIITWNNSTSLPESWWESAQALRIDGTDGTLMPPYVSKTDVIPVFVAELCRTIDLVFQKEVEYAGVPLYRFIMPKDAWDWNLPSNKGFCKSKTGKRLFKEQNSDCLPVGLLDVSRCQIGEPPIVVSQPNFLYSPDYVQQSIEGIQFPAIQERDQIEIDVEPRLGTIIQAHRRFLISISMWKGANLSLSELAHFQSSVVPVLEIDEYIHVDDDSLDLIKTKLLLVEKSAQIGSICGVVFSLMAISAVVAFIFYRKCRRGKSAKRHLSNGRAIVSPTPLAVPNGHTFDQSTF
ncbi:hypothetical protein ACQ4LE_002620 [Meloidogyne hapla]